MQSFQKCREAKENEISFLVEAYRQTLIEFKSKGKDITILPTERTLNTFHQILKSSYERGCKSYIYESEETIIGYIIFIADNIGFDFIKDSCTLATLYVEPEARNLNVGIQLIKFACKKLSEANINIINTSLIGMNYLPRVFKNWGIKKFETLQISLDK